MKLIPHLDILICSEPDRWQLLVRRAWAFAETKQWYRAAADFSRAIELGAAPVRWDPFLAVVQLAVGDSQGYRETCARLWATAASSPSDADRQTTAWICTLAPEAVKEPEHVVQLAKSLLARRLQDPGLKALLGSAFYRAGSYREASQQLAFVETQVETNQQDSYSIEVQQHYRSLARNPVQLTPPADGVKWQGPPSLGRMKVREVRGKVVVIDAEGRRSELRTGSTLTQSAAICTGLASSVDLFEVEAGSVLRLTADSLMKIGTLKYFRGRDETLVEAKVHLAKGTMLGNVKRLSSGSLYNIYTPEGVCAIRGTQFRISADSEVQVISGYLTIRHGNMGYRVEAGQLFRPDTGWIVNGLDPLDRNQVFEPTRRLFAD